MYFQTAADRPMHIERTNMYPLRDLYVALCGAQLSKRAAVESSGNLLYLEVAHDHTKWCKSCKKLERHL